jgi:hypothetical protein
VEDFFYKPFGAGIKFLGLRGLGGNILISKLAFTLGDSYICQSTISAEGCTRIGHDMFWTTTLVILQFSEHSTV